MDQAERSRVEAFVRPLYQDLDGVSRAADLKRVAGIARRLFTPPSEASARTFELLLIFQGLGGWLAKVGNLSRTSLATGIAEIELRRVAAILQALEHPQTDEAIAIASAAVIDEAGIRGLAARMAAARREGMTVMEVARAESSPASPPDWMTAAARLWFERRSARKREFCAELLREFELADLD